MGLRDILAAQDAYKSYECEGVLDVWFYRPAGALFAAFGHRLNLSPNHLTWSTLVCGVAGSCLLYPERWVWAGMGLILLGEIFDAADGQLARLTKKASLSGRVLDGVVGNLVFIATYLALSFKHLSLNPGDSPVLLFLLTAAAGVSHSAQSSLFDYYRTEYIDIVEKRRVADPGEELRASDLNRRRARKEGSPWERFFWWSHEDYARRQRRLAASHVALVRALREKHPGGQVPQEFAAWYKRLNLPLVHSWNLLGSNSRLILLAAVLYLERPVLYFWTEIVLYNAWGLLCHRLQARADRKLRRDSRP